MLTLSIVGEESAKVLLLAVSTSFLLRIGRLPDVGIQGSFLIGGSITASPYWSKWLSDGHLLIFAAGGGGAILGVISALLFVYGRIHSLTVGVLSLLISYSAGFFLLNESTSVKIPVALYTEEDVLFLSLGISVLLLMYLSTYAGIRLGVAMRTPAIFLRTTKSPNKYIFLGLIMGHAIAAVSGNFFVGVEQQMTIQKANDMFFNIIIIMVCGEAVVAVAMAGLKKLKKRYGACRLSFFGDKVNYLISLFRGGGAFYHFSSAVVGTYIYWYLFDITTNYGGSNEYSKGVFAVLTILLLIIVSKLGAVGSVMPKWEFHGVRKW